MSLKRAKKLYRKLEPLIWEGIYPSVSQIAQELDRVCIDVLITFPNYLDDINTLQKKYPGRLSFYGRDHLEEFEWQ